MSARHAAVIAAILLAALAAVGLVLLRPMAPENYAAGDFSFDAVTYIRVTAGTFAYGVTSRELTVEPEDDAFDGLVGFFDGKGFGRTPASLFSVGEPVSRVGDIYWSVTFLCGDTGGSLTADYRGGDLRLTGAGTVAVTAQDKDGWARRVHAAILALMPEPEEPEEPDGASDQT